MEITTDTINDLGNIDFLVSLIENIPYSEKRHNSRLFKYLYDQGMSCKTLSYLWERKIDLPRFWKHVFITHDLTDEFIDIFSNSNIFWQNVFQREGLTHDFVWKHKDRLSIEGCISALFGYRSTFRDEFIADYCIDKGLLNVDIIVDSNFAKWKKSEKFINKYMNKYGELFKNRKSSFGLNYRVSNRKFNFSDSFELFKLFLDSFKRVAKSLMENHSLTVEMVNFLFNEFLEGDKDAIMQFIKARDPNMFCSEPGANERIKEVDEHLENWEIMLKLGDL
jgi:hypothetical protein